MTQGALFPLRVISHLPAVHLGQQVKVSGFADDGMEWMLKRMAEAPFLPATEYFCYRTAEACSLPVPHYGILRDLDGSLVFGSRIEGGLFELSKQPQAEVIQLIASCSGRMSACFAVDLMLGNEDRHFGNFLFRVRADGALACMPIDFGRAWWMTGWPPRPVWTRACRTTTQIDVLKGTGRWSASEALMALGTLTSIPTHAVATWLDVIPAEWLEEEKRSSLLKWWDGPDFHERAKHCIEYCQ